jgi:HK97 gp10 family phage protein
MQLVIQLQNAEKLLAALKAAPLVAVKEYRKAVESIAIKVVQDAQEAAPVGKGYKSGGNLRQSIRYQMLPGASARVTVNAKYGLWVDQGTKPYVILPRRKSFLAFKTKDGNWIRTKRVNHPGIKAQPYFSNAVKNAEGFANKQMQDAADRIFNTL